MNVCQAIFVSVASAGVVASSWFGGPTATAQTSTPPAHVRLGAAHPGAAHLGTAAASGPGTAAAGMSRAAAGKRTAAAGMRRAAAAIGSGPAATARRDGPAPLSRLGRGQLRSGAALQLVSSPAYPSAAYPSTLQAVLDRAHQQVAPVLELAPSLATRTFTALGTVVSISAPMAAEELDAAVETACRVFRDAEEDFGGGGKGLAGRLAEGTMELRHAPRRMRSLYAEAIRWRNALGSVGASVAVPSPLGITSMVTGWAIAHTGQAMMDLQLPHWAIAAGGDVLCSGSPFPAQPSSLDPFYGTGWRAGISDPERPSGLLADVPLAGTPGFTAALATAARRDACTQGARGTAGASRASGTSASSSSPDGFRQVSVLAEDILAADVLSGAILVGGEPVLEAAAREFGVEVLVVGNGPDPGGTFLATAGWPTYRPAARGAHQVVPGSARDARVALADGR